MTNDETHVYFAFSGYDGIWFAFAQLNSNGTLIFNTVGGIPPNTSGGSPPGGYPLKHVSDEGKDVLADYSPPPTRLSIGVNGEGHVFIAYSGSTCGLCVFDSSAPPYTSWTNSLRVTEAFNSPIIFPYLPGQIMVVADNYANIWNGGWGTPSSLSGNDGVRDSYAFVVHGTVYLFEAMSCQQTPGSECVGMFSFSGGEWSLEHATNVPLYGPFQVTYDGSKDRFLIFASDPTNTVLYEYSAEAHATHYRRTTIAAGRIYWAGFVSSQTTIVNAKMHVDNIAVAWFEPNPACSCVNDEYPALMYAYVGPTS